MRMYRQQCAERHCPAFFEEPTTFPHIHFIHFSFTMNFNNKLVKQLLKTVSLTTIHRGISIFVFIF